jgi:hypothetical protein
MRRFVRRAGRAGWNLLARRGPGWTRLHLAWRRMRWRADHGLVIVVAFFLHANAQKLLIMSVALVCAAGLTIYEAVYRHSTPATWYTAVFYSAPLLLASGLFGRMYAVLMGIVVGLMAGLFCRDNGAWFSYIIPNVAEAYAVWLLARQADITAATPMTARVLWKLAGIFMVAITIGASIGAIAIIATNALWFETTLPWSFGQLMLHWIVGDTTAAACAWLVFMILEVSKPPFPTRTA